jgi:hypothetical protein
VRKTKKLGVGTLGTTRRVRSEPLADQADHRIAAPDSVGQEALETLVVEGPLLLEVRLHAARPKLLGDDLSMPSELCRDGAHEYSVQFHRRHQDDPESEARAPAYSVSVRCVEQRLGRQGSLASSARVQRSEAGLTRLVYPWLELLHELLPAG